MQQVKAVWSLLSGLIAAEEAPELGAAMREVIDLCAAAQPHPDWARLRELDYAGDARRMRDWFDQALREEPPTEPVRGLYFALCHPMTDEANLTADMELVGTRRFDPADRGMDWVYSRHYFPDLYASSGAMHRLYGIAHGTHEFGVSVPGVLGNDAEYPVGLAFAVLATRAVLEGRTTGGLPTDADRVGVAAGWADGDLLLIGEVTAAGFVPPTDVVGP